MAWRSTSTATGVNGVTGSLPSGAVPSDVLIAVVGGYYYNTGNVIGTPSGWTLIADQPGTASGVAKLYWALGSVASFAFTSSDHAELSCHIHAFSGRNTASPITAFAFAQKPGGTSTAIAASVTCAAGDDLVCSWTSAAATPSFGSVPSGLTDRANTAYGTNDNQVSSTADNKTAGVIGPFSRVANTSFSENDMFTVAIAAAASSPIFPSASSKRFNSSRHSFGTRK